MALDIATNELESSVSQWSNWEMVADEKLERPFAGKLRGWQSGKRVLTRSSRIIVINSHAIMIPRGNET